MNHDDLKAAAARYAADDYTGHGKSAAKDIDAYALAAYAAASLDETPIDRAWLVKVLGEPTSNNQAGTCPYWAAPGDGDFDRWLWFYENLGTIEAFSSEGFIGDYSTRADALAFFKLVRWEIELGKIIQAFRETAAGGEG